MIIKKKKRGNKVCPKCSGDNGARSFRCKHCDFQFKVSKKPAKVYNFDWKTLLRGDKIRVVGGSGSYYLRENGDKNYLTDRGTYYVVSLEDNGIHVRSVKGGDKQFLYMGVDTKSELCYNLFRSKHKILKCKV